jgi:hypothetical protein
MIPYLSGGIRSLPLAVLYRRQGLFVGGEIRELTTVPVPESRFTGAG